MGLQLRRLLVLLKLPTWWGPPSTLLRTIFGSEAYSEVGQQYLEQLGEFVALFCGEH
jgi:hypothetical protein